MRQAHRPADGRSSGCTTKESWDRFVDAVFMPLMAKGIPGGFTQSPTETLWDVTHLYT
ncbi:MAG: hypothetical protein JO262_04090 [Solirubrobacterales bacterium]|nr:hypothetical protein [Solirubrobacterales bacterium]